MMGHIAKELEMKKWDGKLNVAVIKWVERKWLGEMGRDSTRGSLKLR